MRLYVKAEEAFEEIKRDLAEMGIWVRPKTMQDKIIEGNPDYETTELQNYSYTILNAKSSEIPNVTQPWADAEFQERITKPVDGKFINPGEAWKLRENIWGEFFHNGKFGYTYKRYPFLYNSTICSMTVKSVLQFLLTPAKENDLSTENIASYVSLTTNWANFSPAPIV